MLSMRKKHIFSLILACVLAAVSCAAGAASAYDGVKEPVLSEEFRKGTVFSIAEKEFDTEAMRKLTFGDDVKESDLEKVDRKDGRILWQLKNAEASPFCISGPFMSRMGCTQSNFSIYRRFDTARDTDEPGTAKEKQGKGRWYLYNLDEYNTVPTESGFDAPRAAETVKAAAEVLEKIGITDAEPLWFSTLGRIKGATPCRKVFFRQTLGGLPVRWASEMDMNKDLPLLESCTATVILSDEDGLLTADGFWFSFVPGESRGEAMSEKDAAKRFAEAGMAGRVPEACYFMTLNGGKGAQAIPAWRIGNTYLDAVTGNWLQAA